MYQTPFSQTVTEVINKGKQAINIVLQQKPIHIEIYDNLENEVEKRFKNFVDRKLPLLKEIKPQNPEIFYECFLIRSMIEVLKQMLEERKVMLSENDKNLFKLIFSNDKISIENDAFNLENNTPDINSYFIKSIEKCIKK